MSTNDFTLTPEQEEADKRIKAGENLLIMGEGGTGKTFIVNQNDDGKTLYWAPTGMAALNLNPEKGRTIHSMFKIGEKSLNAHTWQKVAKPILKNIRKIKEFLDGYEKFVIEEGSMIISGLFDTIIRTIQIAYGDDSNVLFHGKQVIFLMDPLQLPCVKNPDSTFLDLKKNIQNELLYTDRIVTNPFFKTLFSKEKGNIINFKKNNRCQDVEWGKVLQIAREGFNNYSDDECKWALKILNTKRIKIEDCLEPENTNMFDSIFNDFSDAEEENGAVNILRMYRENTKTTFKKDDVHEINRREIQSLKKQGKKFEEVDREVMITRSGFIEKIDTFSGNNSEKGKLYDDAINYMDNLSGYNSCKIYDKENKKSRFETKFEIVIGMRVMLRTNSIHDMLKNGSLGEVVEINYSTDSRVETISVKFDKLEGDDKIVNIPRITFKHPDLSFLEIKAFPLIPAWAITIHKLQGQTIDSPLFIDYNKVPYKEKQNHLLYTAISRCKYPNDIYIICNKPITKDFFPVDKIMYKWYIENK